MYPTKKECEDRLSCLETQHESLFESKQKLDDYIQKIEHEKELLKHIITLHNISEVKKE